MPKFDVYDLRARRVIFFARYEASVYGSSQIDVPHLILGLMREDEALTDELRRKIESDTNLTANERIPTSVEMPLSERAKAVLVKAEESANLPGVVTFQHLKLAIESENAAA